MKEQKKSECASCKLLKQEVGRKNSQIGDLETALRKAKDNSLQAIADYKERLTVVQQAVKSMSSRLVQVQKDAESAAKGYELSVSKLNEKHGKIVKKIRDEVRTHEQRSSRFNEWLLENTASFLQHGITLLEDDDRSRWQVG